MTTAAVSFADKRRSMHYAIVAIGSRGDVQPYIALALGIVEQGHTATVLAHGNFEDLVKGYGLSFHSLAGDVKETLLSAEGQKVLRSGRLLAFARYLQKITDSTQEAICRDIYAGCIGADRLIASLLAIPWVDCVADKLQKPWAIVQPNLPSTETSKFPLPGLDFFDFPAFNRLTYRLFAFSFWRSNKKGINRFRKALELPSLQVPILEKIMTQQTPNLYCFSPSLRSAPEDWPPWIRISGYLFVPGYAKSYQPPQELSTWLAAGEAPIYIGFGSIPIPFPEKFNLILQSLLENTPHRFVFCQGWSLPLSIPNHPNLITIDSTDHAWLFPQCKSAIIHGGAGTTAAALRSGLPVIILSIIADQPWWGSIVTKKGVGVHIPFRKITLQNIMEAIALTVSAEMRQRARHLSASIAGENGLHRTLDILEELLPRNFGNLSIKT